MHSPFTCVVICTPEFHVCICTYFFTSVIISVANLFFPTNQCFSTSFCRDFLIFSILISLFVVLSCFLHPTCPKPSCSSSRLHPSSLWQEDPPTPTHSPSGQRPLSWRMERMLLSMRWQWRGPCSTLLLRGEGPETRSKLLNFVQLCDSNLIKIWW